MINSLPYYYRKSEIVKALYAAVQAMLDKLTADIASEDLNLFIVTTSDFAKHEKDVGLAEIDADAEIRRSRVIARIRGNNLFTKSELENLIGAYNDNAGCTIEENYENYTVKVTFSGRPNILLPVMADIEELKPAHLLINYDFSSHEDISGTSHFGGVLSESSYERIKPAV